MGVMVVSPEMLFEFECSFLASQIYKMLANRAVPERVFFEKYQSRKQWRVSQNLFNIRQAIMILFLFP